MSTKIAKVTGSKILAASDLKSSLTQYKKTAAPLIGDGTNLLRLLRDGTWVWSADNREVQEGSKWLINPTTITHGYISWSDDDGPARVLGEVMVPFTEPHPPESELPKVGAPWAEQVAFMVACMDGLDRGSVVLYKTTSVGGKRAHAAILDAVLMRLDEPKVGHQYAPVVTLGATSYDHKKWGKIYNPVLTLVGWAAPDSLDAEVIGTKPRRTRKAPTRRSKAA